MLQEIWDSYSSEEQDIYLNFNLVLSDVSAFLVDGDYHWNKTSDGINLLPVIDKCGIALKLQQVNSTPPTPSLHNTIESKRRGSECDMGPCSFNADPVRESSVSFHKNGDAGSFLGISFLSSTLSSFDGNFKDFSR